MRNLKRVLSLAMAAAMLIGMMVVSAGAVSTYEDFTDKDEIQNTEAVNTMVSLGVINGKDDGSYFDPNGIVTRAEMAALIARCLNGGIDPSLGTGAATTTFTDTKGHWAEAYIAYCANLGIINGKGDGTFGPDEQVTGTAAAKMFLCALGYRSEIEGLTGAGWDLNTDSLANKAGLYDGLTTIRPSDGLTRDNTAQVIYNGVQAQEVEYRNNYGEYSGVIYPQPNGSMLTNRFRVVKVEGVVVANEIFGIDGYASTVTGKSRFVDTNTYTDSSNTVRNYNGVYNVSIDNEMIGQRVVIYVKFQNALSPNAESATVVGEPILSAKNKVVELNKRLAEAKDVTNDVRNGGLSLNTGYSEAHFTAGDSNIAYTTVSGGVSTPHGSATNGITTRPGTRQRFIDNNGDGSVDVLISETYTLSKVSTYNSKDEKLTLTGIETGIRFADIIGEEDVAKDDYVLVIKYNNTYYLSAPETVSGTVTRYVNSKDNAADKLTIDSTDYTQSSGECKATDLLKAFDVNTMRNMVNKDYTLYLDPFGNVLAYELNKDSVGNFALVIGSGAEADLMGSLSGKVKLLMADGTKATYSVDLTASAKRFSDVRSNVPSGYSNSDKEKWMADALENGLASADNTFADGAGNGLVGQIVTYYVNDNGVVTLGQAPKVDSNYTAATAGSSLSLNKNTSSYNFGTNVAADNSTIFFLYHKNGTEETWTAVVGLNKLSGDTNATVNTNAGTYGDVVYYTTGNGSKVAKAIFAETTNKFASSYNYAFTYGQWFKGMDGGNEVWNYNVVLEDGTTTTLTETSFNDHPSKALFSYTLDGSKKAEMSRSHEWAGGDLKDKTVTGLVITGYENGTLAWADAKDTTQRTASAPVSANVKIWNVEDAPDVEEGSVGVGTLCSVVTDNDGAIRTIFVTGAQDEMTAAADVNFSVDGSGTLTTSSAPATWTDAVIGNKLTLNSCNLAAGQKAKISWNGGAAADLILSGTPENPANNVYTLDGALPQTITVKLIISEDGLTSREQTYTIAVSAPADAAGDKIEDAGNKSNAEIQEILDNAADGKAFIDATQAAFTPKEALTVPAGKTLTIKGNLTEEAAKTITTTGDGKVVVTGTYTPAADIAGTVEAQTLALGTTDRNITGKVTVAGNVTGTAALTVNHASATLEVTGNIAGPLTVTSAATVTVGGTVGGALSVAGGTVTVGGVTGATTHADGTLTVKGSADAKITSSGTAQLVLDNTAPAARAAMTVVEVETQDTATLTVKGAVTITTLSGLGNGAAKIDDGAVLTITNAAKAADLEKLDGEKTTTASKLTIVESSDNSTNAAADADAVFWTVPGTTGESNGTAVTSAKIPAGTYTWGSAFHGTNGDTELDGCWVKDADAT